MEIVERYLDSVKNCLPARQAEDIIKELSENIYAQIEDREGELGRNLTEAEVEGILKQHGHPLVVASRYRQEHRSVAFGGQIVGPALFPFYLRVLKFNLGLTSVIVVVIFAALFAGGQSIGTLPQVLLYQLLIQFAIVTAIFWAMDKHFTRFPDRWDPKRPYGTHKPAALSDPDDGPRIPRAKSASQLIALSVALLWLRAVQHSQFLIFGPAAAFLRFAEPWKQLYAPIAALILVGMASAGVTLVRPEWVRFHWALRIFRRVGGLVLCYVIIRSTNPMVIASVIGNSGAEHLAQIVNQTVYYSVLITAATFGVQLAFDTHRLVSYQRGRVAVGEATQRP